MKEDKLSKEYSLFQEFNKNLKKVKKGDEDEIIEKCKDILGLITNKNINCSEIRDMSKNTSKIKLF